MEKHFMLLSLTFSSLLLAQPAGAKKLLPRVGPSESIGRPTDALAQARVLRASSDAPIRVTAAEGAYSREPLPRVAAISAKATSGTSTFLPGEFDLGPKPHEPVDLSCSVHLSLANNLYWPMAILAESVSGCEQPVERIPRLYRLHIKSADECNSTTYAGSMIDPWPYDPPYPPPRSLVLIDHRERICNDLVPARVIVEETVGGVTTTLYAGDPDPITVTGTLETMYAICGETTGFGIVTEDQGSFELIFHGNQQEQFEDGRVARVMGGRTLLQGFCMQDRPAIEVTDMLVCPSTEYVDCMPPASEPKLCTPDAQEWVTKNCPGVSYAF